jgi:hypothetical protein
VSRQGAYGGYGDQVPHIQTEVRVLEWNTLRRCQGSILEHSVRLIILLSHKASNMYEVTVQFQSIEIDRSLHVPVCLLSALRDQH